MPAKILNQNKVEGGALGSRWFLISHTTDEGAPLRCSEIMERKLNAYGRDKRLRPIKKVERHAIDAAQTVQGAAGAPVVAGGNALWTDFVAVLTSSYAVANRDDPAASHDDPDAEVGEFARAIDQIRRARDAASQHLWAAVVEQGDWREYFVAGGPLGEVPELHVLLNDRTKSPFPPVPPGTVLTPDELDARIRLETLAMSPAPKRDAHLSAAVTQLLYADLPTPPT